MIPLVSFVVTYHNEPEPLLRACLESIKALPLSEDEAEIIVVDDGKTLTCQLPFVNCQLIQQEQAGLSVARNTGISYSKGQYIQFVDADDCLIPSAYEAVIGEMRSNSADIILFGRTYRSGKQRARGKRSFPSSDFLRSRNLRAAAWGYTFRRDILGSLRFYPGLLHEDELFTPQLFLKAETVVELDAKAYFYRQHEGTITSSKSPEKVQKRLDDIHFIIKELDSVDELLLERRIKQLTGDYLQNIWMLTHSLKELRRRSEDLLSEGFLPLPLRRYSIRYLLIAFATRIPKLLYPRVVGQRH